MSDESSDRASRSSMKRKASSSLDAVYQRRRRMRMQTLKIHDLSPIRYSIPDIEDGSSESLRLDFEFIERLRAVENAPTTSNVLKTAVQQLRDGEEDTTVAMLRLLQAPPNVDILLITTRAELTSGLNTRFNIMLLHHIHELTPTQGWSIERQIQSLGDSSGQAYQPSRDVPEDEPLTHNASMDVLRTAFFTPTNQLVEHRHSNFLDMANRSGRQFIPPEIIDLDLVHQIRNHTFRGSWSANSVSPAPGIRDWTILTQGPSTSPFHVDHAGHCTFVLGLEGDKIWYVTNGAWERNLHRYRIGGARHTGYPAGISAIRVGPGDSLIQAPGTVHAVVTPSNALITGCFFYAAPHFARSIKCLRMGYSERLQANEDVQDRDYEDLITIITHLALPGLFSDDQLEDIFSELGELLEQEGFLTVHESEVSRTDPDYRASVETAADTTGAGDEEGSEAGRSRRSSKGSKSKRGKKDTPTETPKRKFLRASQDWYWSRYRLFTDDH